MKTGHEKEWDHVQAMLTKSWRNETIGEDQLGKKDVNTFTNLEETSLTLELMKALCEYYKG